MYKARTEPRHLDYSASSPRSLEHTSREFVRGMSDAGLKPVIVYHNLTPAELYEKVGVDEWVGVGGLAAWVGVWCKERAARVGRRELRAWRGVGGRDSIRGKELVHARADPQSRYLHAKQN